MTVSAKARKPKRARPLPFDVTDKSPPPDVEGLLRSTGNVNWAEVYTDMMKADICLFARDVLGLELGPHLIQWGDLIPKHRRIATNAARDHSKSTMWSYAYPIWRVWMDPGEEVYLFSKTFEGACEFIDIIMYGRANLKGLVDIPELAHLVPDPDAVRRDRRLKVTQSDIKFTNGSRIRAMGWGKATRGRHPKYIVCDDILNDEDMYSEMVRRKNIEYFKSAISQMVTPEGQLVVVGCVTEDTWVATERGLQRIGALRPGSKDPQVMHDLELGVEGRHGMHQATKFWDNGVCQTKRITLKTGHKLEGSYRHPLLTMPASGVPSWTRSDEIQPGDWVALRLGTESWGASPEGLDEDTAYLMGLWKEWRVQWAASEAKCVPGSIMSGSRENAVAWLQGYLDGGGNAYFKDGIARVSMSSVSEGLIDDLQMLLGNFGILSSRESPPTERVTNGERLHILRTTGDDARKLGSWGFRLTSKRHAEPLVGTPASVPNQGRLIRGAMDSKPRRPRGEISTLPPFNPGESIRAETIRADTLLAISAWYERFGADVASCEQLRSNATEDLRWVQVASVENGEAYTVDFVVPDGHSFVSNGIVSHNTPFHMADLYGWLRKNKAYKWLVFPGIIKDPKTGKDRALFPWRYSLEQLYAKKAEIGSVAFTREILCRPISDEISVFPQYLFPTLYDETLCIRPTLAQIRARKLTVYMGVDIARSVNVGADYFVIFVIGKDPAGNCHIIDIRRSKGLAFRRQLEEIAIAAQLYDPALIYIESNAMQQIYTAEMRRLTDLPVKEFLTTAQNKYPLDKGVPGLRIGLENQKVVIPRGDDLSVRITDIWINECTQFGFIDGRLQGIGENDDTVMAWWFANEASLAGGFSFAFGDDDSVASDDWQDDGTEERWESVMLGERDGKDEDTAFGV